MTRLHGTLGLASALLAASCLGAGGADDGRILVKPVFLIAADAAEPPPQASPLLTRHLEWAQARYRELLPGHVTFELAPGPPLRLRTTRKLAEYTGSHDGGAEAAVQDLLQHDGVDRFTCPFVYVVLFAATGDWPGGGARPLNGGLDTGGGIVVMSADALTSAPNFQSTLQHELGHAFGLPHVDVYGYDMASNPSFMSYNPAHHTDGLNPSATPGRLIPEDLRALALNQRVFPGLAFDPARDVPPGYSLAPIVPLGPMAIAGQREFTGPLVPAPPPAR